MQKKNVFLPPPPLQASRQAVRGRSWLLESCGALLSSDPLWPCRSLSHHGNFVEILGPLFHSPVLPCPCWSSFRQVSVEIKT